MSIAPPKELNSLYLRNAAEWPALYDAVFAELGNTATIINFGDQRNAGLVSASTFTGRKFHASGLAPIWTPTSVMTGWTIPFNLTFESNWQGVIPVITPSGVTAEKATTPDADYWSFNNNPGVNTDKSFSVGWVCKPPTSISGDNAILSRYAVGEYFFSTQEGEAKVKVILRDASTGVNVTRYQDTVYATGVWHFFIVTYDGGGGATAANGITLYMDGAVVASTATNNAAYVAMENGAGTTFLFHRTAAAGFATGVYAGGPLGPFAAPSTVLTSANVKNLYEIGRLAMGL